MRTTALACALLSLVACSKGGDRPGAASDRPAPIPAAPATALTAAQLEAGAAMVDRLATAMGGADAIGTVRSISVAGTMTRPLPSGAESHARVSTSVRFPNLYRQELTQPAGKVTTLIGPQGGWILAGAEALPLPEDRRLEIENIILRNPVALLKTRRSELFSAAAVDGALQVRVGSKVSTIILGDRGLIDTIAYELPGPKESLRPRVTVYYSDYRTAGPIVYPFESRAESGGAVMYRLTLGSVRVNRPLPDALFTPPRPSR